jgi:DNA-binding SARP family transcriptional activator
VAITGRQRALLGLLLLHAPDIVSVERLVAALWPDGGPSNPAGALQSRISKLRRALAPVGLAEQLVMRDTGYALLVPPEAIDGRRFVALADQATTRLAADDPAGAAELAAQALALWSGDALDGFAHEPWARGEAARLEERRLATLEVEVTARLRLGQHARVVAELEPLVVAHPLREELRALLMVALYRCGRQAEALTVFQEGRRLLTEELGIDPGTQLASLHQRILAQDPQLGSPTTSPAGPEAAGSADPPETSIRLLGRDRELETIARARRRAAMGRGGVLLVTGETGIGRSALLRAAADQAAAAGHLVAVGHCADVPGTRSYRPWAQLLQQLATELEPAALRAALGASAAEVAVVAPELAAHLPGVEPASRADDEPDPFRIQHAVSAFLGRLAAERPLLLAIDDVYVADLASVGVLERVTADAVGLRLLVVLTAPSAGSSSTRGRDGALTHLRALSGVHRLELSGLARAEVAALVRIERGREPSARLVDALTERSGGNPLFALELLHHLDAREVADDAAVEVLGALPPAVRDLVAARLAALDPEVREVLEVGAVLGQVVDAELVAHLLDRDLTAVLAPLEAGVEAGILEHAARDRLTSFRYPHSLVRDTLEAELPPARRATLHAAAGRALASADPGLAASAAHHLALAVPLVPVGEAVDSLLHASDVAASAFAVDEATGMLERARDLLARYGPDQRREVRVWFHLGTLATQTDGFTSERTHEAVRRVRALAGRLSDSPEVVGIRWSHWAYWANRGRVELAMQVAEELLVDGLEVADDDAVAAGHFAVGQSAFLTGDPSRAATHLDQADMLLRGRDRGALERRGLGLLAVNAQAATVHPLWLAGRTADADAMARRAVDQGDLTGNPLDAAHTRMYVAAYHAARDEPSETHLWASDAISEAQRGDLKLIQHLAGTFAGWATAVTGGPDGLAQLDAGLEGLRRAGFSMLRPWHLELRARALLATGRVAAAVHAAEEAIAQANRSGAIFQLATHHLALAAAQAAAGRSEDAARSREHALSTATSQGSPTLAALAARASATA